MTSPVDLRALISAAVEGPFASLLDMAPWEVTARRAAIVTRAIPGLAGYDITDGVAIHRKATVEKGAVVKGPAIIGAGANVEAGAVIANYLNERAEKRIRIAAGGVVNDPGVDKFGALIDNVAHWRGRCPCAGNPVRGGQYRAAAFACRP